MNFDKISQVTWWQARKTLGEIVNSKLRVPDLMCRPGDPTCAVEGNHPVGVPPSW